MDFFQLAYDAFEKAGEPGRDIDLACFGKGTGSGQFLHILKPNLQKGAGAPGAQKAAGRGRRRLFRFLVLSMRLAKAAIFAERNAVWSGLFVLISHIVAPFALSAGQSDRHAHRRRLLN